MVTAQLKYSNGSDAFTFQRSTITGLSESNGRDLFTIEIPFQRDVLGMDFVTTANSIRIQGALTNAAGASDTTAYNASDGGGIRGQLSQLQSLAIPDSDGVQGTLYLTVSDYGVLYDGVQVLIKNFDFEVNENYPVGFIKYTLELMRVTSI